MLALGNTSEDNTVEAPLQRFNEPLCTLSTGACGTVPDNTATEAPAALKQPLATCTRRTVNVPAVVAVYNCAVAPLIAVPLLYHCKLYVPDGAELD
jgi:hypothetical protein